MHASIRLQAFVCGLAILMPLAADAQTSDATPNAQQIVEALQPAPAPAAAPSPAAPVSAAASASMSRTRSSRNLIVRERTDVPDVPAPASLPVAPPPEISLLIQFDFDSAKLRPQGEAALDKVAMALKSPVLASSHFVLEGHTDAKGAAGYNLQLSQSRAEEARRYLLAHGVEPRLVDAVGKGAQEPANAVDPYAPENRRVRIVNVDPRHAP